MKQINKQLITGLLKNPLILSLFIIGIIAIIIIIINIFRKNKKD